MVDVETERGCVGNDVCGECVDVGGCVCGWDTCDATAEALIYTMLEMPYAHPTRRNTQDTDQHDAQQDNHSNTSHATHTHTQPHHTHTQPQHTTPTHLTLQPQPVTTHITTPEAPRTPQHAKPEPQPQPSQVVHMCVVLTEGRAGMQTRMPAAQHCSLLLHRCQGGRGRVEC